MSKYRSRKLGITAPKTAGKVMSSDVLAARPLRELLDQWKHTIETTTRYQGPHAAQCLQVAYDELKAAVEEAGRHRLRVDAETVAKRIGRTAQAVTRLCRNYGAGLGASQLVKHGSWEIDLDEFLKGYRALDLDWRSAQPPQRTVKAKKAPQQTSTMESAA